MQKKKQKNGSEHNAMEEYFILSWLEPLHAERHTLEVGEEASGKRWRSGLNFSEDNEDEDFRSPTKIIEIETAKTFGHQPHIYPEYTSQPIPLMTRRLVDALRDAGVSNLQVFETQLVNPLGTPPPPLNYYWAVNIIGRIAAADIKKSALNPKSKEIMTSVDFYSLSINEKKTQGTLMFRLAENISAVLVHKSVKEHVISCGIDTLSWFTPEEWVG